MFYCNDCAKKNNYPESLQKLIKCTNAELGDNFVDKDYNIFK